MIIIDTNIVARLMQPADAHYKPALDAMTRLANDDAETFSIAMHSLYELYVVMTRSRQRHGFGIAPAQALVELANVQRFYAVAPDTAGCFVRWQTLLSKYQVAGREAFDLKIVATMLEHGHSRLLTFNEGDFKFVTEIETVTPWSVLGIPPVN